MQQSNLETTELISEDPSVRLSARRIRTNPELS